MSTKNTPQKFHIGDEVKVADDLGPSMRHFKGAGELANVVGSYADQFSSGRAPHIYTLRFKDGDQSAWYHEAQLTLVSKIPNLTDAQRFWPFGVGGVIE